jgi:thiol:disulfide interchange protein DsbD
MPVRLFLFLLLRLFFLPAVVFAAPAGMEPSVHTEYFRHGRTPLAALLLELPADSRIYAHTVGAGNASTVLEIYDASGRMMPALYPPGEERRIPGFSRPARSYASGAVLFVLLEESSPRAAGKETEESGASFIGTLSFVLCTERHCTPYRIPLSLRPPEDGLVEVEQSRRAAAFAEARPGSAKAAGAGETHERPYIAALPLLPMPELSGSGAAVPLAAGGANAWEGLVFTPRVFHERLEVSGPASALALGLCAGLLLNFMPCVLPVLALKASVLLRERDAGGARRAREYMLLFAAGILTWFWLLILPIAGAGLIWGQIFQHGLFVYGLSALVFALALSMFGVFRLPLVDLKTGSKSPRVQAFFSGFLATLLATPCSGPLLGGVLAWAFTQNVVTLGAVLTAVGVGMALPYLFLALRPGAARFLPRSGPWLEVAEHLVGFFLMGLVVYLVGLLPEERRMAAMASLPLIALAAWIWGTFREAGVSRRRRVFSGGLALLLLALALAVGTHTRREAVLWEEFSPRAFHALLGAKPIFLVFTADWCPNCKLLENTVLADARLREFQERRGMVFMRVDLTHENERNLALLRALGGAGIPFAALFPAGNARTRPLVLRDLYSAEQLEKAVEDIAREGAR